VEPTQKNSSPETVRPTAGPSFSSLIALQIGVVVVAALYFGREVLIPVTIAVLLSFVLAPIVHLLRRLKLGRVPSSLLAVFVALAILVSIGFAVGTQVAQVAAKIPYYASTIEQKMATVRAYTVDRAAALIEPMRRLITPRTSNEQQPPSSPSSERPPWRASSNAADNEPNKAPNNSQSNAEVHERPPPGPLPFLENYLPSVLTPLANAGIVLVVAIFVLLQKEDLRDRLIRLFGTSDLHRTTAAIDDAAARLSRYFLTQLSINAAFAMVVGAGLYLIGVPNPLLWAIFAGIFRFVPYVGAFLSAALPIALAAAVDPGWSMVWWTLGLYLVVELTVSQVIEPILYGHSTGLSPFAVIVSAIFWTWIWGPIGLVLSTPMTLCLVVLGRHVDRLEFFDVLLGDRPALTPVESFYQRILAGDVDEIQDHAELLLKQRSLSSYYDEVALKGMRLAATDAERGVLRPRQLDGVRTAIEVLVKELAGYDDEEPKVATAEETEAAGIPKREKATAKRAPARKLAEDENILAGWRTEQPVLCLGGKGPLDEAASCMLSQLLEKHGIGARVSAFATASREAIGSLDVADVAMVCVSYLDISGNPPHLRYLIKRLRLRLPKALLLVGIWSSNETLTEEQKRLIDADFYTTSLREAIDVCVKEATRKPEAAEPQRAKCGGAAAERQASSNAVVAITSRGRP
jgi:predicted PurR-regulated permease PerM